MSTFSRCYTFKDTFRNIVILTWCGLGALDRMCSFSVHKDGKIASRKSILQSGSMTRHWKTLSVHQPRVETMLEACRTGLFPLLIDGNNDKNTEKRLVVFVHHFNFQCGIKTKTLELPVLSGGTAEQGFESVLSVIKLPVFLLLFSFNLKKTKKFPIAVL